MVFLLKVEKAVKVSVERFPVDDFILKIDLIRMPFQKIHAEHAIKGEYFTFQVDDHGSRLFSLERADSDLPKLDFL